MKRVTSLAAATYIRAQLAGTLVEGKAIEVGEPYVERKIDLSTRV
jgi:hypothetical protein